MNKQLALIVLSTISFIFASSATAAEQDEKVVRAASLFRKENGK